MKRIGRFFNRLNNFRVGSQKRVIVFTRKRPFTSFLVTLILLFLVILLGKFLTPPVKEIPTPEITKEVNVLSVGETPTIKTVATVEKTGVIVISALTPGVVSKIHVSEGDEVARGKTLVSLSSNYQGGNAASISRRIVGKNYQNLKENFDSQKEIIQKQMEVAEKNAGNTENLSKISVSSNDDTKGLLSLNEQILANIDTNLNSLISNNTGGANDALILQTRQSKAQVLLGMNSLRSAIRSADYSTNTGNPPSQLSNLNKDVTLKQLELQEKALILNKEISRLNLSLAAVSEAMMFPSSPGAGSVQKIHVNVGQLVNPGTPLVTIYAPAGNVKAVLRVPSNIAKSVSLASVAHLWIGDQNVMSTPDFISTEATDGNLYQIIFNLPDYLQGNLTDGEFITVELPIGADTTSGAFPFVPLDSIFQTQDSAYLYVVDEDKAASRTVTLGEVIGGDVEIKDGLKSGDKVILNRNVLAEDKVVTK